MRARRTLTTVGLSLVAGSLASAGCGPLGDAGAVDETRLAHHSWLGYHWAGASPVRVTYVDDIAAKRSAWREHLAPAAAAWTRPGLATALTAAPRERGCVAMDGAVAVCTVTERRAAWLASTSVWTAPGSLEILRAQILLNDAYVRDHGAAGLRRVVCHEMGHALGLAHTDDVTSCMSERTDASPLPNAHDLELLDATYPAPAAPAPVAAVTTSDEEPRHAGGRHELTKKREPNGEQRFTWTTPARGDH